MAKLEDRDLIRVGGPDRAPFLQGLLSQDVEGMAPGDSRYAALLTPQGRLLYDLFLFADDEAVILDVAASVRAAFLARLTMYRLRARVELALDPRGVFALWGGATAPSPFKLDPRLPAAGFRAISAEPPAGNASGASGEEYADHRIALGLADIVADGLSDTAYALDANLDLLNGVDFAKGCFVGQETTSRMKRRSGAKSRIAPLSLPPGVELTVGAEVLNGERRVGEVTAARPGRALALLRIDRASEGGLTVDGAPVSLDLPPWLAGAFEPTAPVAS